MLKDLRKDVAKEREAMKVRTQKLQSQIQSRKLQEEKKAAKQKEKEERDARAELQEKIKNDHKEQEKERKNSKKPSLKQRGSNADLKDEGHTLNERKHPKGGIKTGQSPGDRFFAKIGSDILSPALKKAKNGTLRNQLAKQSTHSDRLESRDSNFGPQSSIK